MMNYFVSCKVFVEQEYFLFIDLFEGACQNMLLWKFVDPIMKQLLLSRFGCSATADS
jgi:hypothetical protein